VATNNNLLGINGSNQNRDSDLLKKIEDLIETEEFEEARSLLDILIQDDSDPLKRNLIKKMDDIIQDSG
jgi:chemotaxis methyl-accepting protein methylase